MKAAFWLVVLIGGAGVGVYYAGGYASFDPDKQGRDARAALKPGMTLDESIEVMGSPRKYRILYKKVQDFGGSKIEVVEPGAENPFKKETVEQRIAEGSLPEGFLVTMRFSNKTAFTVTFDKDGRVKNVEDAMTMADLLDARD